jgi:hypothetical protein
LDLAVEYGHLNIVQFFHTHLPKGCDTWSMKLAAKNGHLDIVRWLYFNQQRECDDSIYWCIDKATHYGHLDVVNFFLEQGYK